MHSASLVALIVASYWAVTRAARLAGVIFRLILAALIALFLMHGWL